MSRKFFEFTQEEKDEVSKRLREFLFNYYENFEKDADIVREFNIPRATISRWLSGEITLDFLKFLQKEYNLNINWLLTGKGKPFKKSL